MMKVTITSSDICLVRSALYNAANNYYDLAQRASEPARRENYTAEGDKCYQLAEKLKLTDSLEGYSNAVS